MVLVQEGRLALKGTEWAQAQVDTIRLKLFKVGALVRISARRVWLELNDHRLKAGGLDCD